MARYTSLVFFLVIYGCRSCLEAKRNSSTSSWWGTSSPGGRFLSQLQIWGASFEALTIDQLTWSEKGLVMWCTEWFHSPNAIFRGLEHGSRARSYWCVKSLMFDPSLLCFCCFVLCRFKNGPRRLLERRAAARHGRSGLLLRSLEDVLQKVMSWEQMNSMVDVLYWFSCVFLWYSASMTCFQPINQFDMFRYIECRWHRHFFAENRFSHCTWSWVPTDRFSPGIRDYVGAVEDATDAIQAAGVRPEFWRRHTAGVIHVAYGGAKIIGVEQNSRWWQLQQTSPREKRNGSFECFWQRCFVIFCPWSLGMGSSYLTHIFLGWGPTN